MNNNKLRKDWEKEYSFYETSLIWAAKEVPESIEFYKKQMRDFIEALIESEVAKTIERMENSMAANQENAKWNPEDLKAKES